MIDDLVFEALKYSSKKQFCFKVKKPVDSCHYSIKQQEERALDEGVRALDKVL